MNTDLSAIKESIDAKAVELNTKMEGFEKSIADIKEIAEKNGGETPEALEQKLIKMQQSADDTSKEYKELFDTQKGLNEKMQEQLDAMDIKSQRAVTKENHVKSFITDKKEALEQIGAGADTDPDLTASGDGCQVLHTMKYGLDQPPSF